jgi:hypothetical protein
LSLDHRGEHDVEPQQELSRRHVVHAASRTLAAASLSSSAAKGNAPMADTDLTNPVTRCPKLERFGGMTPLGRPGQPVELASIYV